MSLPPTDIVSASICVGGMSLDLSWPSTSKVVAAVHARGVNTTGRRDPSLPIAFAGPASDDRWQPASVQPDPMAPSPEAYESPTDTTVIGGPSACTGVAVNTWAPMVARVSNDATPALTTRDVLNVISFDVLVRYVPIPVTVIVCGVP